MKSVYLAQDLTKGTTNKPRANVELCQSNGEQEYWIEQVRHGPICDQHIYRFS